MGRLFGGRKLFCRFFRWSVFLNKNSFFLSRRWAEGLGACLGLDEPTILPAPRDVGELGSTLKWFLFACSADHNCLHPLFLLLCVALTGPRWTLRLRKQLKCSKQCRWITNGIVLNKRLNKTTRFFLNDWPSAGRLS